MAFIEFEVKSPRFAELIRLVVSTAPIPVPTLPSLGQDRLISKIVWEDIEILPGVPGILTAQAPITISHSSIAELRANPKAIPQVTQGVASLLVSASPSGLTVALASVHFEAQGQDDFSPPLLLTELTERDLKLPGDMTADIPVTIFGAAIIASAEVFTVRFATSPDDDLFAPAANRLLDKDDEWLICISGNALAEILVTEITKGMKKLDSDSGIAIEDEPSASWSWVPTTGKWAAVGSVGIVKVDACFSIFEVFDPSFAVDLSVNINTRVTFAPNAEFRKVGDEILKTTLTVTSDVSDWDSARCWAGSAGVLSAIFAALFPPLGISVGIGSLFAISELIRMFVGVEIAKESPTGNFMKVASDIGSATYEETIKLKTALPQSVLLSSAEAGAEGVVWMGKFGFLPPAEHLSEFTPDGGRLEGTWQGHYSCSQHRWEQNFLTPSIRVADSAVVIGQRFKTVPVKIFDTSQIEPASHWRYEVLTTVEAIQYVGVVSIDVSQGDECRLFLHTSAGICCFDIPPLQAPPPVPNELDLGIMAVVNCRLYQEIFTPRVKLGWLIDPPPFHYGYPPLRQWLLTIEHLPDGASAVLHEHERADNARPRQRQVSRVVAERAGALWIERVTNDKTELDLELKMPSGEGGIRLAQRWLLPLRIIDLGAPATALTRVNQSVFTLTREQLVEVNLSSNDTSFSPTRQRGLAVDLGRLVLWGDEGVYELDGLRARQLISKPVLAVYRDQEGRLIYIGRSKAFYIDGRTAPLREQKETPSAIHEFLPASLTLDGGQIVAPWGQQLIFATSSVTNIQVDRIQMPNA
ncbi:hypothetical protein [Deinococcus sonorensis]|uniref:Tip attachment protein J domain-containing protein n=2 Tax=Deinococcus sonorensis TaxID=309891 RepID=A0AAU7UI56_9DEIO